MNSTQDVELHKSGRLNTMEKRKEIRDGVLTPPKLQTKIARSTCTTILKIKWDMTTTSDPTKSLSGCGRTSMVK